MEQISEQKLQELVNAIIGEYKMKGSISTKIGRASCRERV